MDALAFLFLHVFYTILKLAKFPIEWYIIVRVLLGYDGKIFLQKWG
jgi:hypothetical protein